MNSILSLIAFIFFATFIKTIECSDCSSNCSCKEITTLCCKNECSTTYRQYDCPSTDSPLFFPTSIPIYGPTNSPTTLLYDNLVDIGVCNEFVLLAGAALTFTGSLTTISIGSIGIAPGTSITGNYALDDGTIEENTSLANQCANDELIAYEKASIAVCTNLLSSADLSGLILLPGVYCTSSGTMTISSGTVTLDGQGNSNAVWIFQTLSTLTTASSTSFVLINEAKASNVFWKIGSSATIGSSSNFIGIILAYASITINSNTIFNGKAFAQTAITFAGGNTVINV